MSTQPERLPWSLAGKTAVVTGASRGIGQAIAIYLAKKGLENLAVTYVAQAAAAEAVIEECRRIGVKKAVAIRADLLDPEFGSTVINGALKGLDVSVIDILVNNAVLTDMSLSEPVTQITDDGFAKTMRGNVYSAVTAINTLLPHLPKHGGRIINISSVAAKMANDDPLMPYGASKAALESFTRSYAKAFAASKGATFNNVSVGPTVTDASLAVKDFIPAGYLERIAEQITAAKRLGKPEEVAYVVGFLASEESQWINGANVSANGGLNDYLAAM
ncbi:3-oxoacyl-[acyl-carrier protein] reductase [Geosmithia morbida]|uniref:3-oxoacyl-[acyl-carrier protein] reductase n=1 Tax=Geosmithia morbida TaxID=1094350 RepID=A0A9P4YS83_9HYPO|nr:3-oxoacyl-[acyl-carrier protein] reductase [Geosmithia morbida]KAF4120834.1 3-oxoacyl-[acyl-carrier protein] reductase [Geosmithia morbida]